MKKLLLILAAAASISLASCGSKAPADTDATADTAATEITVAPQAEAEEATLNSAAVVELKAGETVHPDSQPVVVDFNATWCGPCKRFAPAFHEVAALYAAKATFMSCDVDKCEAFSKENNVQTIPCIMIFYPESTGRTPVRHEGYMSADEFKTFLDKNL